MSVTSLAVGRAFAGEQDAILRPRLASQAAARRGVIICHPAGYGGSAAVGSNAVVTGFPKIVAAIVNAGYAAVSTDLGGTFTWANDTVATRMGQARTLLNTLGCKTDKVLILGMSMGNMSALRYAADNPGAVAAIASVVPACDIDDMRDNDRGGVRAGINTAWGLSSTDTSATVAIPTRGRALQRGADVVGLPWRGYYSNADTVCPPSTVTAMVSAIGSSASKMQVSTTADHPGTGASTNDTDSVGVVDTADLLAFLATYAG